MRSEIHGIIGAAVLGLVVGLGLMAGSRNAQAQQQNIVEQGKGGRYGPWAVTLTSTTTTTAGISSLTYPVGVTTKEPIFCNASSTSPCVINAGTSTPVLAANPTRSSALICATNTAAIYCCMTAATSSACLGVGLSATSTAYDVSLKATVAANDGSGSCWTLGGTSGRLWDGPVVCTATATSSLSVYAY
jgi:hypothetical protein